MKGESDSSAYRGCGVVRICNLKHHAHAITLVLFLVISSFILTLPHAAHGQTLISPQHIDDAITSYIDSRQDDYVGVTVVVTSAEGTITSQYRGYEDLSAMRHVDKHTVFEWGEISQILVWISALQLEESGVIDLDTPINEYLPDDSSIPKLAGSETTFRDLMTNTGGYDARRIERVTPLLSGVQAAQQEIDINRLGTLHAQLFMPGTVYTNTGFQATLGAFIIEQVSGQPFDQYVEANIFDPLGMEHTQINEGSPVFGNPQNALSQARDDVTGYGINNLPLDNARVSFSYWPAEGCMGTAEDLAILARALSGDGNNQLFSNEETLQTLFLSQSVYPGTNVTRAASGFIQIPGTRGVWGIFGQTPGMSASLCISPEDHIGVVVLTNSTVATSLTEGIPELLFGAMSSQSTAALEDPTRWEGSYQIADFSHNSIESFLGFLGRYVVQVDGTDLIIDGITFKQVQPGLYVNPADYAPDAAVRLTEDSRYGTVLSFPAQDAIRVSADKQLLEFVLFGLYIAAFLYCALALVITPLRVIIANHFKTPERYRSKAMRKFMSSSQHKPTFSPVKISEINDTKQSGEQRIFFHIDKSHADKTRYFVEFITVVTVVLMFVLVLELLLGQPTILSMRPLRIALQVSSVLLGMGVLVLLVRTGQTFGRNASTALRIITVFAALIVLSTLLYWEFVL